MGRTRREAFPCAVIEKLADAVRATRCLWPSTLSNAKHCEVRGSEQLQ